MRAGIIFLIFSLIAIKAHSKAGTHSISSCTQIKKTNEAPNPHNKKKKKPRHKKDENVGKWWLRFLAVLILGGSAIVGLIYLTKHVLALTGPSIWGIIIDYFMLIMAGYVIVFLSMMILLALFKPYDELILPVETFDDVSQ